jgi:RNA polymerase sigma factor (sigma-70 family)
MATRQLSRVLQRLRKAALQVDAVSMSDGSLLDLFIHHKDALAFEVLLRRHGPMVLGVCLRILRNQHDAEDAFQATFLVLVRKAASVLPRDRVGPWLHGVALCTARQAHKAAARRRMKEQQATSMPHQATPDDPWQDMQPLLDQEVARLPEQYRVALVLCDLEGKSRKDVARLLGCPEGTVASRLARARAMLARRLAKHGLPLSAASLTLLLTEKVGFACVSPALLASTQHAATRFAAGHALAAVVSAKVACLTKGTLGAMFMSKLKTAVGLGLVLLLVLASVTAFRTQASATTATGAAEDKLEDTILVLDKQFWEAAAKHDVDSLDKLLADNWVGLDIHGTKWTRPAILKWYATHRLTDLHLASAKEVFRVNKTTVLVTCNAKFTIVPKAGGTGGVVDHALTMCWVQRDGGWFLAFSRASDLVPPIVDVSPSVKEQPKDKDVLQALIAKVLKAHGGEVKLTGIKAFLLKVKQIDPPETTSGYFIQTPDQCRVNTLVLDTLQDVFVFDAGTILRWKKDGDRMVEVKYKGAERSNDYWKDTVKFFGPRCVLRLKDPDHQVSLLGDTNIGGRTVVGVLLKRKVGPDLKYYFDKKTSLLLKVEDRADNLETYYGDYTDFDGIPMARKRVQHVLNDDSTIIQSELLGFRIMDKIDAKVFKQP